MGRSHRKRSHSRSPRRAQTSSREQREVKSSSNRRQKEEVGELESGFCILNEEVSLFRTEAACETRDGRNDEEAAAVRGY